MILEYSITVGSLLQSALLIAAATAAFYTLKGDVNVLKHDVRNIQDNQKAMTEAFTQLEKILTQVAVQDTRIHMIEKKVDELSHGQGFIKEKKQ